MTRQFRRRSLRMRTAAQKRCPVSFERRMLTAYAEHPATMNSRAMIGHDPRCKFVRGGACDCEPDIHLILPDGSLVEVDPAGRVEKAARNDRASCPQF
jgi:hypothetical protein